MVRENRSESSAKEDEKILLAQGFDSSTTGPQWDVDSRSRGSGLYQVGHDLKGNGCITKIDRTDEHTCTITLESAAKLNFKNNHIVRVERPDGSTFEMHHGENGALKGIKLPSGDSFERKDGHWYSADGAKTDRIFDSNIYGSVWEGRATDDTAGILHYPDGTSVSGHFIHVGDRTSPAITKIEHLGKTLIECHHDEEGYLKDFKLNSGEHWQRQGPMKWKSSAGAAFEGSFYFDYGRHLRRKDVDGHQDVQFKPF